MCVKCLISVVTGYYNLVFVTGSYVCYILKQIEVRFIEIHSVKVSATKLCYHPINKGIICLKNTFLDNYYPTKLQAQTSMLAQKKTVKWPVLGIKKKERKENTPNMDEPTTVESTEQSYQVSTDYVTAEPCMSFCFFWFHINEGWWLNNYNYALTMRSVYGFCEKRQRRWRQRQSRRQTPTISELAHNLKKMHTVTNWAYRFDSFI